MITFTQFKEYLEESRKNPEMNPKISAYDALLPYKDDPSISITFANGKVGIKPLARYDTPLGIYAYPLKQSWKYYNVKQTKSFGSFPYGLLYNDIFILRKKSNTKELNLSILSENDYINLTNKLLSILKKDPKYKSGKSSEAFSELYKKCTKYGFIGIFPKHGSHINVDDFEFDNIIKGTIEYNTAITELKKLETIYHTDFDIIDQVTRQINLFKKSNISYGMKFYNLTANIVKFYYEPHKQFTTTKTDLKHTFTTEDHIKRWRSLFVELGFDLVTDDGDYIIHDNEPCQSFFVDSTKFEIVGSVKNKEYKDVNLITDPVEALGYFNYKVDSKAVKLNTHDIWYVRTNYKEIAVDIIRVLNNKDKILKIISDHKNR
jgi:hypothetical protein